MKIEKKYLHDLSLSKRAEIEENNDRFDLFVFDGGCESICGLDLDELLELADFLTQVVKERKQE